METTIHRVSRDHGLESSKRDEFLASHTDGTSVFWIDVEEPTPSELSDLLQPLELHPLALGHCLEPAAAPSLTPYENALFMKLPAQRTWDDPEHVFLGVLCLKQTLLTVHTSDLPLLTKLRGDFSTSMRFHSASASAILYQMIDRLIDEDLAFALAARRGIEALEERVDGDLKSEFIEQIRTLKRRVEHIGDTIEDQHYGITSLQTTETEFFDVSDLRIYFRDSLAQLEHALTSMDRQEGRLAELHQHYLLALQDRTNRRLKVLTILSAVFMPLTLIAGIYGMNFHRMPELQWAWAYPAVLMGMLLIAALLLWNFFRRGWFD